MHLLISLVLNSLALIITDYIVPGFTLADYTTAVLAAIVLAVINTFIKPILLFLTFPLTIVTLGLFIFVINAVILYLAALVVPDVQIDGFLPAILAAVVLSVISTILSMLAKDIGKRK
jgi:putative membrane protein